MEEYLVPTKAGQDEFTERRSRFIGCVFPVETEQAAVEQIKKLREQHWSANHHVYAYILHSGAMRYSDDSEPQGTAGMPVLEVLRREKLEDVLCVAVRYFGGILLGTGGLTRAYTKAAKIGVDAAGISCKQVWDTVLLPCAYPLYERLKKEISAFGGKIADTQFGAGVELTAAVPHRITEEFLARITDVTGGSVRGTVSGSEYRAFPIESQGASI